MSKAHTLKKKLIKLAIIGSAVVLVSGAAAYGIFSWSTSLQEEAKSAKSKVTRARGDVSNREDKNRQALEYMELYNKITTDSEQNKISDLNRDKALEWLKNAALSNNITNMDGGVEPISAIESPAFKKKTMEGITSKVTLKFAAMTDEQIYNFLNDLMTEFPGYIKVNRFNIIRENYITEQVLRDAARGRFPELVKGDLEFHWIGIREINPENAQGAR